MATGQEDLSEAPVDTWNRRTPRFAEAHGANPEKARAPPPDEDRSSEVYRISYVGLWDTVGSLGLPTSIPFISALTNRKYKFHDTRASSLIGSLRHACALDEDRKVFDITEVSNIDKLNAEWAAAEQQSYPTRRKKKGPPPQVDYPDKPGFVAYWDRPFQQQWFPGSHGSVGGGNPEHGLSSGALVWIAVGAMRAGLKFEWAGYSELARAKVERTPCAPWRVRKDGRTQAPWVFDFLGFLTGYRDRKGPKAEHEISWAALERVRGCPDYRPATLKRFTCAVRPTPPHRIAARVAMALAWTVILSLAHFKLFGHWPFTPGALRLYGEWLVAARTWLEGVLR